MIPILPQNLSRVNYMVPSCCNWINKVLTKFSSTIKFNYDTINKIKSHDEALMKYQINNHCLGEMNTLILATAAT